LKANPEKLEKSINKKSLNNVSNAIPDEYFDAVKNVMGEMKLNPACEMSQWPGGRAFLNIYIWSKGSKLIPILMEELESGNVKEAIVSTNNHSIDENWYQSLFNGTICFTNRRNGNNKKRVCFVYFGPNRNKFISEFSQFGNVVEKVNRRNPYLPPVDNG
jgi:hypothetical protein